MEIYTKIVSNLIKTIQNLMNITSNIIKITPNVIKITSNLTVRSGDIPDTDSEEGSCVDFGNLTDGDSDGSSDDSSDEYETEEEESCDDPSDDEYDPEGSSPPKVWASTIIFLNISTRVCYIFW